MTPGIVWRMLFVISALLFLLGGPRHPGGTMLEMLQDPEWIPAHVLLTLGFLAYSGGLWVWGRLGAGDTTVRRWWRWAVAAAVLQTLDMGLHTMAYIDADRLAAGASTPTLSTHLIATVIIYPIFALVSAAFLVIVARAELFGSVWIAPLGLAGLACHGLAPILVFALGIEGARVLFPLLMLFALWTLLAALWPIRAEA